MDIKSILNFIKATLEANVISAVRAIKGHTYTVKLDSPKVEVTNHPAFPKVQNVKVTNPPSNADVVKAHKINTDKLAKDISTQLARLEKSLRPLKDVTVTNLKDIAPLAKVQVTNPQKRVAISNLFEVAKEIGKLKKSVDALKLNPTITVPDVIVPEFRFPEIKVPETKVTMDLTKLEELMSVLSNDPKNPLAVRLSDGDKFYEAIFEAVSGGSSKSYAYQKLDGERTYGLVDAKRNVRVSSDDRYGLNHQEKVGNVNYLGQEDADGEWLITKVEKTGSTTTMRYATVINNGMIESYTDAWDNRATLSYDLYSLAF